MESFKIGLDTMLLSNPTTAMLYSFINTIMLGRKGFGHSGGGTSFGASAGKAKALIVVIILVLIIPLIALLFSGPTTGSSGLYGNATVAFNVRQGTASFAQFVVVILVLGAVGIVLSLI